MRAVDIATAQRIARKHYGKRVTHAEAVAEVKNCKRKRAAGTLDDFAEKLCAAFINAGLIEKE